MALELTEYWGIFNASAMRTVVVVTMGVRAPVHKTCGSAKRKVNKPEAIINDAGKPTTKLFVHIALIHEIRLILSGRFSRYTRVAKLMDFVTV